MGAPTSIEKQDNDDSVIFERVECSCSRSPGHFLHKSVSREFCDALHLDAALLQIFLSQSSSSSASSRPNLPPLVVPAMQQIASSWRSLTVAS